jgi:hypothetical protein
VYACSSSAGRRNRPPPEADFRLKIKGFADFEDFICHKKAKKINHGLAPGFACGYAEASRFSRIFLDTEASENTENCNHGFTP